MCVHTGYTEHRPSKGFADSAPNKGRTAALFRRVLLTVRCVCVCVCVYVCRYVWCPYPCSVAAYSSTTQSHSVTTGPPCASCVSTTTSIGSIAVRRATRWGLTRETSQPTLACCASHQVRSMSLLHSCCLWSHRTPSLRTSRVAGWLCGVCDCVCVCVCVCRQNQQDQCNVCRQWQLHCVHPGGPRT